MQHCKGSQKTAQAYRQLMKSGEVENLHTRRQKGNSKLKYCLS